MPVPRIIIELAAALANLHPEHRAALLRALDDENRARPDDDA